MRSCPPEASAFAESVAAQARAIRNIPSMGASRARLARIRLERAASNATETVDAFIEGNVLRPDDTWAPRIIAGHLLEQLRHEATGAVCPEDAGAMREILSRCQRRAEALVRARLNSRTHPVGARGVFTRLETLRAQLDDPIAWGIALRRLAALSRLEEVTWRGLEHAPCWAAVRALGREHASDTEYGRSLETLAVDLGQWAAPHAAEAAKRANVQLSGPGQPVDIDTVLRAWPWPQAMPPLPAVAACAEVGRSTLSTHEWAAAATLDSISGPVTAEELNVEIDTLAPKLRNLIEEALERNAIEQLAELFVDGEDRHPSPDERRRMLGRMRVRWAANEHLAPKHAREHALGVDTSGSHEIIRTPVGWLPRSLEGAVHWLPALVWRIPETIALRALAGSLPGYIANDDATHHAFAIYASVPERAIKVPRVPGCGADYEAYASRAEAIEEILDGLREKFARCSDT